MACSVGSEAQQSTTAAVRVDGLALTKERFLEAVITEFNLFEGVELTASLTEDLDLDSLDVLNLVMFSEELAEVQIDGSDFPMLLTLDDAYKYAISLQFRSVD